jgi:hypothetical protein
MRETAAKGRIMAQTDTPRGHDPHRERIAFDTAEWHRRLDELVELRRESASLQAADSPVNGHASTAV